MRTFILGAFAAVVAAAAWFGIEYISRMEFPWLAIGVGLAAGWGVRKGADIGGTGYARGTLAAVLALVAIVGGRQVYAAVMQATHDNTTSLVRAIDVEEEATEEPAPVEAEQVEGAADEEVAEVVVESQIRERAGDNLALEALARPAKPSGSMFDMVWICVAAVAAYVIGKGDGAAPSSATPETPAPTQAAN